MARPPGEPPEAGGEAPMKQQPGTVTYDDDLTAPVKEVQEKWKLLPHFLQLRGLMRQHIDSFNYFVNREIKDIVNASSNREVSGGWPGHGALSCPSTHLPTLFFNRPPLRIAAVGGGPQVLAALHGRAGRGAVGGRRRLRQLPHHALPVPSARLHLLRAHYGECALHAGPADRGQARRDDRAHPHHAALLQVHPHREDGRGAGGEKGGSIWRGWPAWVDLAASVGEGEGGGEDVGASSNLGWRDP